MWVVIRAGYIVPIYGHSLLYRVFVTNRPNTYKTQRSNIAQWGQKEANHTMSVWYMVILLTYTYVKNIEYRGISIVFETCTFTFSTTWCLNVRPRDVLKPWGPAKRMSAIMKEEVNRVSQCIQPTTILNEAPKILIKKMSVKFHF